MLDAGVIGMELKVEKFNNLIIESCKKILGCHKDLTSLTNDYAFNKLDRASVDRNLVIVSVASQKLMDLVLPIPSSGEIHGLPKEATTLGIEPDVLIVNKDKPEWDFKPWFTEKVSAMKDAVNRLLEYLETDPKDVKLHPSASITSEAYLSGFISMNMSEIEHMANTILEMMLSGKLIVTDVKLEED